MPAAPHDGEHSDNTQTALQALSQPSNQLAQRGTAKFQIHTEKSVCLTVPLQRTR